MDALVRRLENKLRAGWRAMVRGIKDGNALTSIEQKIATNNLGALIDGIEDAVTHFSADLAAGYVNAGQRAAREIDNAISRAFRFNVADDDAIRWMQETARQIAQPLIEEQQAVARRVVQLGRARGLSPRAIAHEVQASVGLTMGQVDQVHRYRTLLEAGDYRRALSYELADGRYDQTLRRAANEGTYLGTKRIDAMVDRYRENWNRSRSDTIGLSEANNAANAGVTEAYAQAIEQELLDEDAPIKRWVTRGDHKVRGSHRFAHGQHRKIWESYVLGSGNRARYPGDPRLPARDTANCRCISVVTIDGEVGAVPFGGPRQIVRSAPDPEERSTFRLP